MRNICTAFNYCIKCNCQSYKNKEIQGANTQCLKERKRGAIYQQSVQYD